MIFNGGKKGRKKPFNSPDEFVDWYNTNIDRISLKYGKNVANILSSYYNEVLQEFNPNAKKAMVANLVDVFLNIYSDASQTATEHINKLISSGLFPDIPQANKDILNDTFTAKIKDMAERHAGFAGDTAEQEAENARFSAITEQEIKDKIKSHATFIAENEANTGFHTARHEALKQFNFGDTVDIWSTEKDDRVRPAHRAMEGKQREADGYFHLPGGFKALYPGDEDLPGELRFGCRCVVVQGIVMEDGEVKYV